MKFAGDSPAVDQHIIANTTSMYGTPCAPPSDEAKPGVFKRALFEHVAAKRIVRVAQRPAWLRNAGHPKDGAPGRRFVWLLYFGRAK
jgi:hypothetical protein